MRTIHNPVVRGVAPDPSICRVGDDFYLATSTMRFWPGIPIRHSRDLVNWRLVGHAVTRAAQYRRDGRPGELMLYAPTLRHLGGRFWLACTNVADGQGNFLVSADDAAGEWSDAVWVDDAAFDPSLAIGDDGQWLYTRRTLRPDADGFGPIVQAVIDPDTGVTAGEPVAITPGRSGYCSNDIEGPHLFKRGQWWYLCSAEGGTWAGHMQTVGRSRDPWGLFEGAPGNPVLTHRHRTGHPIQSVGHADLVEDADGNWWAVCLGTRREPFRHHHQLGRETFLAPVEWVDDWPVIGNDGTIELTMPLGRSLPGGDREDAASSVPGDAFGGAQLDPWLAGWSTRGLPLPGIRLTTDGQVAAAALPAASGTLDAAGDVSAVFLRQEEPNSVFTAVLETPPASGRAGVSVYAGPRHHHDLTVTPIEGDRLITLRLRVGELEQVSQARLAGTRPTRLRVSSTPLHYRFEAGDVADDPAHQRESLCLGQAEMTTLSAETADEFCGVRFALFAEHAEASFCNVIHEPVRAAGAATDAERGEAP